MREIKFRGKRIDNGEWVYGSLNLFNCKQGAESQIVLPDGSFYKVIPETVGQYTGLPDRNGVEICEGDTVVSFKKDYEDTPTTNIVEFTKGCWKLVSKGLNDIPLFNYSSKQLDITGNIHDNQLVINKPNTNDTRSI